MGNIIAIILFVSLAGAMHAVQDILCFNYGDSIFSKLNWDYLKPDYLRKYVNHDKAQGRKRFLGIKIHPLFFEGYKLAQTLREGFFVIAISIAQNFINEWLCFLILSVVVNAAFAPLYDKYFLKGE